jgi:hypothetical protein
MSLRERKPSKGDRSMKPGTKRTTKQEAKTSSSRNRIYRADLGRTDAGSPIIKIVPLNPKGPLASHRQISAFIYDLASEMETRSEVLGATWAISPEAWNSRIVLELGSTNEAKAADEFVRTLLADRNLD